MHNPVPLNRCNKIKSTLPLLLNNSDNEKRGDVVHEFSDQPTTHNVVQYPVMLEREEQPVGLKIPIVAYATACVLPDLLLSDDSTAFSDSLT